MTKLQYKGELRSYIEESIAGLREMYMENMLEEEERISIRAQLEVLENVKRICDKRGRY